MAHFSTFIVIATLAFAGYSHADANIPMPSNCVGKKYCTEKPENYQNYEEDFDRYIKKSKYWLGLGAKNRHPEDSVHSVHPDAVNCGSITRVEKPFIISVNTTGSDNKIVVQSEYFEQRIKTTTCLDKTCPCFEVLKQEQDDIETGCDERYSTITIYVYENGRIRPQPFPIPVSCTCKVQFKSMKK